ncbi:MAG: O-antigen polymerase [Bacteroidota bacterium]
MNDWFQIVIVYLLMVVMTLFIRRIEKSWLAPAALFPLVWSAILGMSLLLAPGFYFSAGALFFVFLQIFMFFAGSILAKSSSGNAEGGMVGQNITDDFFFSRTPRLKGFVYVGIVTGFCASILLLREHQFIFGQISDFHYVVDTISGMSDERYEGIRLSRGIMLCISMAYAGNLVAGFLLAMTRKTSERILMIFSLIPLILFTLIYTARAVFLFGAIMFLASFLAGKLFQKGTAFKLFTLNRLLVALFFAVFIPSLFLLTQLARYNTHDFSTYQVMEVWDKLSVWFFGNFSGFSVWFDSRPEICLQWGKFTLSGLFEQFSDYQREGGIFSTMVHIDNNQRYTNIYTIFRFLMEDFSYTGTTVVIFVAGYLSQWFLKQLLGRSLLGVVGVAFVTAIILFSFITSIVAYNATLFAFAFFGIALWLVFRRGKRAGPLT